MLTVGSDAVSSPDNGSAFTAHRFRARLADLGIRHRRGGYGDRSGRLPRWGSSKGTNRKSTAPIFGLNKARILCS